MQANDRNLLCDERSPSVTRIFTGLALLSLLLLLGNMTYGLLFGDFNAAAAKLREADQRLTDARLRSRDPNAAESVEAKLEFERVRQATRPVLLHAEYHKLLGLATAIVSVLVNSIAVTYFIGTGRWCQEVVDTYRLAPDFIQRSKRLKRKTFPWSLTGMLTILAISGLGAASDPLNSLPNASEWVSYHLIAAIGGVMLIGFAYLQQYLSIQANLNLIGEILASVDHVRADRHLDDQAVAHDP